MKALNDYKISYTGLSLGKHEFDFEVNDEFFKHFENPELTNCNIDVFVDLEKRSTMIELLFDFEGEITVTCDRCGEELEITIGGHERLIVQYGDGSLEEHTDDILVLPASEHQIDLTQYIYEYIMVSIPQSHSHELKDCNPEVIKKLNELSINNSEDKPGDPRWDSLKNFKNEQ